LLQHNFARGYSRSEEMVSCRFLHLYKSDFKQKVAFFYIIIMGKWWYIGGYSISTLNHHAPSVSAVGIPYTATLQRIVLKPWHVSIIRNVS